MLEFVESLRSSIRKMRMDTESILISGAVRDMEQYRFLMGRLEGIRFVEEAVQDLLEDHPID